MIKRLSRVLISIFCFMLTISGVFAYNLNISSDISKEGDYVEFYTIVKSSRTSREYFASKGATNGKFIFVDKSSGLGNSWESYDIMGILFHKDTLSSYDNPGTETPINSYGIYTSNKNKNVIYADGYSKEIKFDKEKSDEVNLQNMLKYITDEPNNKDMYRLNIKHTDITDDDPENMESTLSSHNAKFYEVDSREFLLPEYTILGSKNEYVIYKYKVLKSVFDELKDYGCVNDPDSDPYVYVSFVTKTGFTGYMYTAQQFYDSVFTKGQTFAELEQSSIEMKTLEKELAALQVQYDAAGYISDSSAQTGFLNNINKKEIEISTKKIFLTAKINLLKKKYDEEGSLLWAPYTKGIDFDGTYQRGYATANDYDNRLYLPPEDKTIYVNYLKKDKATSELSLLYVAPKEDTAGADTHHKIKIGDSVYFNITDCDSYKQSIKECIVNQVDKNSKDYKEYEKYVIGIENEEKEFLTQYMHPDELNEKLKITSDNKKYKYLKLKCLKGTSSSTYEELRDEVIADELESSGNIQTSPNKRITAKIASTTSEKVNTNPILISFVYQRAIKEMPVKIEHVVKETGEIIPIALYGNELYNIQDDGSKEKATRYPEQSTELLMTYGVEYEQESCMADNLKRATFDLNGHEYTYMKEAKKCGYYSSDTSGIPLTTDLIDYEDENYPIYFSPSEYIENNMHSIKITYYYEVKESDKEPPTSGEEFPMCIHLSFSATTGNKTYDRTSSLAYDCETDHTGNFGLANVTNGKICDECLKPKDFQIDPLFWDENNRASESLYVPTNSNLKGIIDTKYFYLNYGLLQSISFTEKTVEIVTYTKLCQEYSYSHCSASGGEHISGCAKYKETLYYEENIDKTKDKVKLYQRYAKNEETMFLPKSEEGGNVVTIINDIGNEKIVESNRTYIDIQPPKYDNKGHLIGYEKWQCTRSGNTLDIKKSFVVTVKEVEVNVLDFKSYYLDSMKVENYSDDDTKLFGKSNENVVNEDSALIDNNTEYRKEKLEEIIKGNFESKGTFSCSDYGVSALEYKPRVSKNVKYYNLNGGLASVNVEYCLNGDEYITPTGLSALYYQQPYTNGDPNKLTGDVRTSQINAITGTFNTDDLYVDNNKYNGERLSIAKLRYLNFEYYSENKELYLVDNSSVYINLYEGEYEVIDNTKEIYKESGTFGINVLNPAELDIPKVIASTKIVSQTVGAKEVFNLQTGVETSVIPKLSTQDSIYGLGISARKKVIGKYIYEFNFPARYKGIDYPADTPIVVEVSPNDVKDENYYIDDGEAKYLDDRGKIVFTPIGYATKKIGGDYTTSNVEIRVNTIKVTAVTINAPSDYLELYKAGQSDGKYFTIKTLTLGEYSCTDDVTFKDTTNNDKSSVLTNLNKAIRNDAYYLSEAKAISSTNISRLYDFRVTDCTDVNYKDVFRKTENGVNQNTGIVYFSGMKLLNVYENTYTTVSNSQTILPLGPYKATTNYVDAPKLGYRISFDFKTSGYYDYKNNTAQKRTAVVFPKLYYISKDGKTFEYNVDAYYKNSAGKYTKIPQADYFEESSTFINAVNGKSYGGYKITYKPNDGYRNVLNIGITNVTDMFTTDTKTIDTSAIVIDRTQMCSNNDGFIQSWYGEYKLPNSTILVKSGETNLNNNLTNGYVGVVFYIGVVEEVSGNKVVISYNTSNKLTESKYNTTQWDYESYLGFTTPGQALSGTLSLNLQSGTWNIDDATYQKIKGTVILYDIDNRAASDFE